MQPERVFVGLGANLGGRSGDDRAALQASLHSALQQMAALPGTDIVAASGFWRSKPVDAVGPDYLNAVVELQTGLEPLPLLHALQTIEAAHGRQRLFRNAPRTLDLDLLLFGQRVLDGPVLTLPHPRLHERAFVLEPLFEIAPEVLHPLLGALARWRQLAAGQSLRRLA